MERQEILEVVRTHLVEELDVEPDEVVETTNFREDLEADSLDLYTLLQELEDRFGMKLTDQQAAEIETVAQAIDAVEKYATGDSEQGP
ncbi:MAG: acyl carrier protein [Solirubrobacterales bacterium]|nr:acyl carrier protein [Solirubrobacterales bacterium]